MQHPPLKRHAALRPLSRDHYVGLVQAQRLLKAADGDDVRRRQALSEFVDAWDQEIAVHFDDEQRLLPPLLGAADGQRLEREHAALRELAGEAQQRRRRIDPGADWMRQLGRQLHDHIRWEERELFPALEASTPPTRLHDLEQATRALEATRPRTRRQGDSR